MLIKLSIVYYLHNVHSICYSITIIGMLCKRITPDIVYIHLFELDSLSLTIIVLCVPSHFATRRRLF